MTGQAATLYARRTRGTVPTMFHGRFNVERGGLASYTADYRELGLRKLEEGSP